MSIPAKAPPSGDIMEQVIIKGDLSKLTQEERVRYYNEVCRSIGLNPLTQPFDYVNLNGKLRLYALRACADQLRKINNVSLEIISRDVQDDVLTIHVRAKIRNLVDGDIRVDEDLGSVPFPPTLKGEARANAELKAVTKAKRRVTLSICGLGWLDETEVDSIPEARKKPPEPAPNVMLDPAKVNVRAPTLEETEEGRAFIEQACVKPGDLEAHPVPQQSYASMKELAEDARAAAHKGRPAMNRFWKTLTDSEKALLKDMGDELKQIMGGKVMESAPDEEGLGA